MDTTLAQQMLTRADLDNLPEDHDMRTLALKFEEAALGFAAEPQTFTAQQFLGHYARAKRAWSNHTGEPLI
jgi:hypothetical protein